MIKSAGSLFLTLAFLVLAFTATGQSEWYVDFCAKSGQMGGAFLSMHSVDTVRGTTEDLGSWGMYNTSGTPEVGDVPAEMRDYFTVQGNDSHMRLSLTQQEYSQLQVVVANWKGKSPQEQSQQYIDFLTESLNVCVNYVTALETAGYESRPDAYLEAVIAQSK